MNRKIGMWCSVINAAAVIAFAVSMLFDFLFGCYFSSMFIAFSFVPMMCAYAHYSEPKAKTAGYIAVAFAAVYAALILTVYFSQLTTVRFGGLNAQASALLDFNQMGLFFYYDMLGYAMMSLAVFFAGLTVCAVDKADKLLKAALLVHGVFFVSCLLMPLFNVFTTDSPKWIGVAVLEFWSLYFCPIGILSFRYFKNREEA